MGRTAKTLLLFMLANGLLINWALPHLPWQPQTTTTLDYTEAFFDHAAHADSWKAMRTALFYTDQTDETDETHEKPLYTALYFDNNVRFQYPPSSLLVLELLRASWLDDPIGNRRLNLVSWLCVWGLAGVLARIFFLARRHFGLPAGASRSDEILLAAVAVGFTLTFYPIVRGYYLGQIQVWIDLLIGLVVWSWLERRKTASGFFLSLICVIKPTLALVVIWGALRRQWDFIRGFAIPMACFALLSLIFYGWDNHIDYLGVLSYISQQGEIFHPNQSMNGLLHRLLHNGNSLEWERNLLMTYNPWVHAGTVVSSLALMGAGLIASRATRQSTGPLELAIIITCATLASPTVWTHHYGVILPLFAIALPAVLALDSRARPRDLALLVTSFMLISNNFRLLNRLADTPFNILQSYVYFGGLIFLVLLFRLRASASRV
ncbi:MAG: DUF2029 domain-containing protein [Deltaproteobacteria bacterium]|nr:DUF2029 domain-containing protein [Deltaproteobacteria bacterium]MBW2387198.1 DUF2029 domain-containing protein [Deltaproteobacteria bacterium]